ncbi:hypothetical protein K469DRAFT_103675 [Zopfia rhizophila CBS 207.26]|uniref:Uncharacterized protein n=1 Tax=Zopfia rhizophila CBS 207.26 TaxID=1314779 RepID=A0A6A6E9C9_9PEZI|nr:hypothetical protein K469DRAFT_103675 [Zopfia rhizophila CBS 207.26]
MISSAPTIHHTIATGNHRQWHHIHHVNQHRSPGTCSPVVRLNGCRCRTKDA